MAPKSKYVLIVDNLSSITRSRDIKKVNKALAAIGQAAAPTMISTLCFINPPGSRPQEMEYWGPVREVERLVKERCALVEFDRCARARGRPAASPPPRAAPRLQPPASRGVQCARR